MWPVDFAVLGLFLGVVLTHALAVTVVVASNGVTAFLYENAGKFGWNWFSDRSSYPDILAIVDGSFFIVAVVGLAVALWRTMPQWLSWKSLHSPRSRGREFSIPASLPVYVLSLLGWLTLLLMAIYALQSVPEWIVDVSRDLYLVVFIMADSELSESTIARLRILDRIALFPIFLCVSLSHSWAENRCRPSVTSTP